MKTTTEINKKEVFEILKKASWSYEHCGDRIQAGDMEKYIAEIEQNLSEGVVNMVIQDQEDSIISDFENQNEYTDLSTFAALLVADSVGHQLVDCVYPTVFFRV